MITRLLGENHNTNMPFSNTSQIKSSIYHRQYNALTQAFKCIQLCDFAKNL
jgi:hypothetical protein